MRKKNKKGFTLVELLAVIVILAIILVIAVPKISNVIESSRKSTFEETALNIVKAANYYYATSLLETSEQGLITFTVNNDKLMSGDNELSISGKAPVGDSWVKINEVGNVALRITDGVYYASKDFDETGVIVTEDEEAALTREELATELAELRTVVTNLTTTINENTSDISELNGLFSTIQQTVTQQDDKFTALNSAIGTVKENTTLLSTTPLSLGARTAYCEISLTPGTYVLYGWIRATGGSSGTYLRSNFINDDFEGLSPSDTISGTLHSSSTSYVTVTSTKTINYGAYTNANLTITNCSIKALRIK